MAAAGGVVELQEKLILVSADLRIEAYCGDLTTETADAVVNSTSRRLQHKAGVAAALSTAAGPNMQAECDSYVKVNGSIDVGDVATTSAGNLRATRVLHTVAPGFDDDAGGDRDCARDMLTAVYGACLDAAVSSGSASVCFPALGAGRLGVPAELSAEAALAALAERAAAKSLGSLRLVRFVDLRPSTVRAFTAQLRAAVRRFAGAAITVEKLSALPVAAADDFSSSDSGDQSDVDFGDDVWATDGQPQPAVAVRPAAVEADDQGQCPVCMELLVESEEYGMAQTLEKCGHRFHKICLQVERSPGYLAAAVCAFVEESFRVQPKCPICKTWYGVPKGRQPAGGSMKIDFIENGSIPGFPGKSGHYQIQYHIPSGIQTPDHPNPGVPFSGTSRVAFIPNTEHGQVVLKLLRLAFDHGLIFTVGTSVTSGQANTTVWNNIHHKTNVTGGADHFGYPDETYLARVEAELADAGITRDLIKS